MEELNKFPYLHIRDPEHVTELLRSLIGGGKEKLQVTHGIVLARRVSGGRVLARI